MYYGQNEIDKFLNENFIFNKKDGFFIECGAHDGVFDSTCKFFEDELCWHGINIEASSSLFKMLTNNRSKSINLNVCLSSKNGYKKFYKCYDKDGKETGCGSVSRSKEFVRYLKENELTCQDPTYIRSLKFDTIVNKYKIKKINLFVLDVEGHEKEALKGILDIKEEILPDIFCIEHGHIGIDVLKSILEKKYKFETVCPSNINAIFSKIL